MPTFKPLGIAFWSKVDRRAADECWPWLGHRNHRGYGRFTRRFGSGTSKSRHVPAARMAWELTHLQEFPVGHHACHRCDNPPCCNPAHVFPGTDRDNMRDCVAKGRHWNTKKTRCKRGHEFTASNTIKRGNTRTCRACKNAAGVITVRRRRDLHT